MKFSNSMILKAFVALLFLTGEIDDHKASATTYAAYLSVSIGPGDELIFRLASDIGLQAPIGDLHVFGAQAGEWDYKHPVWSMFMPAGSYLRVSEVRYGVVVKGFAASHADALVDGRHYLAMISGAGISETVEFEIVKCDGKTSLRVFGRGSGKPSP